MKVCNGGKEALKGDADALNGDGKALKSNEEGLKAMGRRKRTTKIPSSVTGAFKGNGVTSEGVIG